MTRRTAQLVQGESQIVHGATGKHAKAHVKRHFVSH